MSFQLTIAEGKEAGKEFVFDQSQVVIGRTSDCDVILYDPGVSRKHARIFSQGEANFVEDMGSSNGTKVNGNLVKKKQLADGDNITLGPVVFNYSAKIAPEVATEAAAGEKPGGVEDLHTRIVTADQVKRQKGKGVALLPADANPEQVKELSRTNTTTMQAVRKSISGNNHPAVPPAKASPDGDTSPRASAPLERPPRAEAPARSEEAADPDETRAPARVARAPLSAAERARIRRESKGMLGLLRIFWSEASDAVRGLAVAGAVVVLGGMVGTVYYFAIRAGQTGPTRAEPAMLERKPLEDSFGLGDGVTWERPDMKLFTFEYNTPLRAVVLIHYQAKDVSQGEVAVTVNGVDVGTVPPDTLNSGERSHELIVVPGALKKSEPNQVIFDNTKNPPGDDPWRIWNVWVETAVLPDIPPDQLLLEAKTSVERAQQFADRKDVGAENRYEAWKAYRTAWLMLEAAPEPKPELYLLARDKVKEAQQELDQTCAKLLLEVETYYNHKDWNSARYTLDHVKDYFPGTDQPCPFRAEQKRYEHGL